MDSEPLKLILKSNDWGHFVSCLSDFGNAPEYKKLKGDTAPSKKPARRTCFLMPISSIEGSDRNCSRAAARKNIGGARPRRINI